jgi:hypothetical protein
MGKGNTNGKAVDYRDAMLDLARFHERMAETFRAAKDLLPITRTSQVEDCEQFVSALDELDDRRGAVWRDRVRPGLIAEIQEARRMVTTSEGSDPGR